MSSNNKNLPYQIDELNFGTSTSQPVLSISRLPDGVLFDSARKLDVSHLSRLEPLFSALPNALTSRELEVGNYMKVKINGQLAVAKDGTGNLPWTRTNGRIDEVARLTEPERLTNLVNAAALFQIASIVVAQKHLADINEKLDDIKYGIDRIERFQENERKSKIYGILKYLHQVSNSVLLGEVTDAVRNQLEDCERNLLSLYEHLHTDIFREIDEIKNCGSINSTKQHEFFEKHQADIIYLLEQLLISLRSRAAVWQLLCAFPGEHQLKKSRQIDIQLTIDKLTANNGILSEIDYLIKHKVATLHSFWEAQSTLNRKKSDIWGNVDKSLTSVRLNTRKVKDELYKGETMLLEFQEPVTLALKVKEGEIMEAYQILS